MRQWYQELFANSGKAYDQEAFTTGTVGECDFIECELDYNSQKTILDIGCGTGRHSIELSKRGFSVRGIDLSESQIKRAREKAEIAGLKIDFEIMDACRMNFVSCFDMAIMLCEGAFPLMETDEMNYAILAGAFQALRPKGRFIFTTLNGLFPLHHSTSEFCNQDGCITDYSDSKFDLLTMRDYSTISTIDDDGNKVVLQCNERYYMPSEIVWLLKSLGFVNIHIGAAVLGKFSRLHALSIDDYEMMVICDKPAV